MLTVANPVASKLISYESYLYYIVHRRLLFAQNRLNTQATDEVKQHYTKAETYITMRDGVKLFTAFYIPKKATPVRPYPILLQRTCYGIAPMAWTAIPTD